MSLDEQLRHSLDTTLGHLARDLEERLQALVADLDDHARREREARVDEARRSCEVDAARRLDDALEAARRESEASRQQAVAEIRREAEDRIAGMEVETRTALHAAEQEAERRLVEALAARNAAEAEAVAAAECRARADERESRLAGFERLLAAFERIDACTTLTSTLDALADGLATEAARSMLLVVRGQDLRAWRLHGFSEPVDAASVRVPMAEAAGLAEAVHSGRAVRIHTDALGDQASRALSFARLGEREMGLAVPVSIGMERVAVAYADDGAVADRTVPASWPEVVDILARHASRHLSALTALRLSSHCGCVAPSRRVDGAERGFATHYAAACSAGAAATFAGPPGVDTR